MGGLIVADGCAAACRQLPAYSNELANMSCTDVDPGTASGAQMWQKMGGQFTESFFSAMSDHLDMVAMFCGAPTREACTAKLASMGCAVIEDWKNYTRSFIREYNACSGDWLGDWMQTLPLWSVCPVTCNCSAHIAAAS